MYDYLETPAVAIELDTVERNIRTIILRAWRVNRKGLQELAGYPLEGPPPVSDFLQILVSYLRRHALVGC